MKSRNRLRALTMLLLFVAYGLGYWTGASRARPGPRWVMARDASDISPSVAGETVRACYDPYFTSRNAISDGE
ncbi:MAG TPA: hypothetical protein VHI52_04525 [Verrucomicrobiae bacterium]|nr:hypothetical protein [Verrucomicrobiae bacterium]